MLWRYLVSNLVSTVSSATASVAGWGCWRAGLSALGLLEGLVLSSRSARLTVPSFSPPVITSPDTGAPTGAADGLVGPIAGLATDSVAGLVTGAVSDFITGGITSCASG